jgi:hypothetical protein
MRSYLPGAARRRATPDVMTHSQALTDARRSIVQLVLPSGRRGPQSTLECRNFIDAVFWFRSLENHLQHVRALVALSPSKRIIKTLQIRVDESSSVRANQDAAGEARDPKRCSGSLSSWLPHEDPCARRCDRSVATHRDHTEASSTNAHCRIHAPRACQGLKVHADTRYNSGACEAARHEASDSWPACAQEKAHLDRRSYFARYRVEFLPPAQSLLWSPPHPSSDPGRAVAGAWVNDS